MFRKFINFYSPEDSNTTAPTIPSTDNKEDVIKFLGEEDDDKDEVIPLKEEKKDDKKEKELDDEDHEENEEEVKEEDELKEIEEELEEPDEEKLELVTPVSRREILKKYPNVFKDFPSLESALYRNYQFSEIFPTIGDAKQTVEKAEIIDKIDKDISDGNLERILLATKNGKSFNKLVDNYLPLLAKVDEKAYTHVVGSVIKSAIKSMVREGQASKNEALQAAAQILNQFTFGSSEFEDVKPLSGNDNKPDTREEELNRERMKFVQEKYESINSELETKVTNSIKATIAANIDPKESMTEYVRKNATREAMETVEELIERDKQFKTLVDRLWEKAAQNNFSKPDVDRIRNAFFAKAKTLLPAAIKKARNDALRGMGKRVKEENGDERTEKVVNRSSTDKSERKSSNTDKSKVPAGMSTLEYLMQD